MSHIDPGEQILRTDSRDPAQISLLGDRDVEVNGHSFYSPFFGEWACRHCDEGWAGGEPTTGMQLRPCPRPRARRTDPDTSHEAAAGAVDTARHQRAHILRVLKEEGPLTADEIDALIGWRLTSAGRRLPELAETGAVERTTERRPTRTGSMAYVWRVTR